MSEMRNNLMMNRSVVNKAVIKLVLAGLAFGVMASARADAPPVKQGTQATVRVLMQNTSGTGLTGLTVSIVIEKPGQHTFSAPTGSVIEDGNGWYELLASTTDTNTLGPLAVHATATGAVPYDKEVPIVAFDPNDASLLGLSGVATATTQGTQGTTLAAVSAKTALIATNAADSPNEVTSQGQAASLLLSLATYQSVLTTGSTTTALNTALTGTADLTGGKVVFTAGVNKGVARTIAAMNSTTGVITLLSAVPNTPGATDAFSVVQGSKVLEQFLAALGTDSRPVLSANAQPNIGITNALPAIDGTGRVTLVPGQSTTASNFTAAPTPAQVASAILLTPANLLATNASNQVTTSNPAASGSTVTEATIWGYATRALTDKTGFTATASNLPSDYQQRAVAVTLPTTAPTGYGAGAGGGTAQTGDLFALINPLVSAGKYTALALSLAPSGGGGVTDSTVTADVIAALTAQGYTVTRSAKMDNMDATVSGVSSRLFAYTLAGTTFGDHVINSSAVTWGNTVPTYNGLVQTSPFTLGGTTYVTSTLTRNSSGQTVSRAGALANQ